MRYVIGLDNHIHLIQDYINGISGGLSFNLYQTLSEEGVVCDKVSANRVLERIVSRALGVAIVATALYDTSYVERNNLPVIYEHVYDAVLQYLEQYVNYKEAGDGQWVDWVDDQLGLTITHVEDVLDIASTLSSMIIEELAVAGIVTHRLFVIMSNQFANELYQCLRRMVTMDDEVSINFRTRMITITAFNYKSIRNESSRVA